METEGPPIRYPNLSSADVFGAGESTLAESPPLSPRTQLPAYGDERAPPQYQEDGVSEKEKASNKAKARRTLLIRALSSIFITVLVSLIVAAAVGRIHDSQEQSMQSSSLDAQTANITNMAVTQAPSPSTTGPILLTVTANEAQMTPSPSASASTSPSTSTSLHQTIFDCPNGPSPTLVTIKSSVVWPTGVQNAKPSQVTQQNMNKRDDVLQGVQVFAVGDCMVTRVPYKGSSDNLTYRCIMTC